MRLHGRRYIIDYCLSYQKQYTKERIYKSYIADALKTLNELVSGAFGGSLSLDRYEDRVAELNARARSKKPERTAEEIKNTVFDRIDEFNNAWMGGEKNE